MGGELLFSDIFADRRIPAPLLEDPVLIGECLSGALYGEDFRRIMAGAGCADVRAVSSAPVTMSNPDIDRKIGFIGFTSGDRGGEGAVGDPGARTDGILAVPAR